MTITVAKASKTCYGIRTIIRVLNDERKLHRIDGPAKILVSKNYIDKTWYKNGKKHRENAPADISICRNDGDHTEEYYNDGRIYYAKIIRANGNYDEFFYKNGIFHREDGPAYVSYKNDEVIDERFYIDGKIITDQFQIMIMKGLNNEEKNL